MSNKKPWIVLAIVLLMGAFFYFDLGRLLSLDAIKARQGELATLYAQKPWMVLGAFFVLYVAVTALSLPGAVIMTLAGGALFGLVVGTLVVSFASSIGATLAFLAARHLLRDSVKARFGTLLAEVDRGIAREGGFYLFTLRLVPLFPFFVVNLLMGLTAMKTRTYYAVSQVGMLAGTLVYVNAGTQLAQLDSLKGILSPGLLGSFVLLGLFPLLAKKGVDGVQARRVLAPWAAVRPKAFDRNLVVIGAGAAGLVSSYIAATVRAKVTLVEAHKMGGDCLNYGCVPSKALIRTATLLSQIKQAPRYGLERADAQVDFAQVMQRVADVVKQVEPHDSVARYSALGVDVRLGHARIVDPWRVAITAADGSTTTLSTRSIVIATGAQPFVPPLPGLAEIGCLTSDTLWGLRELPRRLVVLGGGPIGCELAQCFARLGSQVTQVEMAPRVLAREDEDVSALVAQALREDGIELLTGHQALRCEREGDAKWLVVAQAGVERRIPFDHLLCAVGRASRLEGYGLQELGIPTGRTIETNEYLQTRIPNIYAAGDVAGPYQFTHTAAHQAWYAAVNALFGRFKQFKADYRVIPWTTFTDPEVARVGLNEADAKAQGVAFEVTRYGLDDLDRAIADSDAHGFVKVLTAPGSDRILGVTIVGAHAGELLAEWVLAMKHGLGLNKILGTIHTYPTWSESAKYAAGEWKKARKPEKLLGWVERFMAWQRGRA
ncbi:pyruvate/2-oxoglutarate dehydrogenase complex, dihydrolipoamide dehydrogenase component [Burkholderiales bacterium JOSHI_001]|nr:pyruvate/2-oxoglutarate dehydrogenase complex, dihydrolipoamide dehydrogenase component [Burkholderiales bacterium JOSHI_001]